MKRLALSVLGGLVVPFLYAVVVGPLTPYIKHQTVNFLAMVPVRWPIMLVYRFEVLQFESEWWLLLLIVGGNVIVYGSVIYFVLFVLSLREKTSQPTV